MTLINRQGRTFRVEYVRSDKLWRVVDVADRTFDFWGMTRDDALLQLGDWNGRCNAAMEAFV
jgi:hypothetical protein